MASVGFMGPSTSRLAGVMQTVNSHNVPYIALLLSMVPWAIAYLNLGVNNVPENVRPYIC